MSSLMRASSTLQVAAVVYLLAIRFVEGRPSVWDIQVDNEPAPPAQSGPPLSYNAVRDKRYLGVQLGAIFGAWVLSLIIVATALLTIGRRLRRSIESTPNSLHAEMFAPTGTGKAAGERIRITPLSPAKSDTFDPSPVSPAKPKSPWAGSVRKHKQEQSYASSVMTFDESVIEEDKMKNEIELDRLYAAVARHDEQIAHSRKQSNASTQPPKSPFNQHPPELQHLRNAGRQIQPEPVVQEDEIFPSRTTTVSPSQISRVGTRSPKIRSNKPTPISIAQPLHGSRASSTTSFGSHKHKRSIRDLPISPPMGSPDFQPENLHIYGDTEPLTPRYYAPGPPPSPPNRYRDNKSQQSQKSQPTSPRQFNFSSPTREDRLSRNASNASSRPPNSPTKYHTPIDSFPPQNFAQAQPYSAQPHHARFPSDLPPSDPAINHLMAVTIDPPKVLPLPNPNQNLSTTSLSKPKKVPTPLPIGGNNSSAQSSTRSLPLRSAPLPLRNIAVSNSSQRPPSMIKNTVIESKPKNSGPKSSNPLSGGGRLKTPMTGIPQTPYSPYMPRTPLTPLTPSRLVGRKELKQRRKEEGRRVLGAEDVVAEEGEMWGDAYS